ncbi:ubiquitin-like autophagy protein Apg12-domain-containing protein [Phyllosticta capitalensis]|uniref:ubiquitin-like autophagy protein Apg12-domain-containing protein n=1 Tax=Phyllosticta capitalensis TaxID=121624 RepID=UPI00312DE19E
MPPAPPGAFSPRHSPSGSGSEHYHQQQHPQQPQPPEDNPSSPPLPTHDQGAPEEDSDNDPADPQLNLQHSQLLPSHPKGLHGYRGGGGAEARGSEHSTASASPSPDDDANQDMPMTMAASVVLAQLPRDARGALEKAARGPEGVEKVTVRFRPVGSAPQLRQPVAKVSASSRFETVVRFLRRRLGVHDSESVFCYVNSVFAPGLDEGVGNLWRCFKTKDELVVAYSVTPAFG